ncbi:MAG: aspartate aminotransferase family protein [Methanoculleaceae archaeon]
MDPEERGLIERYYMPVFSRNIKLVRGRGARVWDDTGKEYIDCVAGIAVCSTGHCHPRVVEAICRQAEDLIHCSNLYHIPGQAELARDIAEITGLDRVFLTNSGAEANEAAIKLARIRTGRKKMVALTGSFHGRTMGSLAITYKPEIRLPFEPLEPRCTFVDPDDISGLEKAVDDGTAAVFVEPVQGESGIHPVPHEMLRAIREVCDDHGALMVADEVQSGMGRTGTWLAIEHAGVKPDIVSLAKGLGSGFPIGAIAARDDLVFRQGEHGSTFAGGPLACAAARATIEIIRELLPDIPPKSRRFEERLSRHSPRVCGLMIGITAGERCPEIQRRCAERGVLVNCAGGGTIRLVPPLVITRSEIDQATSVIDEAIG